MAPSPPPPARAPAVRSPLSTRIRLSGSSSLTSPRAGWPVDGDAVQAPPSVRGEQGDGHRGHLWPEAETSRAELAEGTEAVQQGQDEETVRRRALCWVRASEMSPHGGSRRSEACPGPRVKRGSRNQHVTGRRGR